MTGALDWVNFFVNLQRGKEEDLMRRELLKGQLESERALGRPIYQEFPEDELSQGYKSPITWGMMEKLRLTPSHLPRRDVEGLGIRIPPAERKEYQPKLFTHKGRPTWVEPGQPIPSGAQPYEQEQLGINVQQFIKLMNDPYAGTYLRRDPEAKRLYDDLMKKIGPALREEMGIPAEAEEETIPYDPAMYRGKTVTDTKTGKRYKSNGKEWVEIK